MKAGSKTKEFPTFLLQTVPEECDSIRNLRSIIDSAPSLERESPNEELIKKESQDDPCYSGII